MARPTVAEIRLSALRHNVHAIRSMLPQGVGLLGIVKANAYGHGALPVARALEADAARMLGVATVEEGVELRQGGIRLPVVVLGGVDPLQAEEAHAYGLSAALFDLGQIGYIARAAEAAGRPFPVHVKVDTGMSRLGVAPAEAAALLTSLAAIDGVEPSEGQLDYARKRLDAVGICVVGGLAAFGGGTMRDVVLDGDDREPECAGMPRGKIVGVEVRNNCDGLRPVERLKTLRGEDERLI